MPDKPAIIDHSLKKVARGAGIASLGLVAALLFGFLGRLLVARYGTEAEYGTYSFAIAVLMICTIIGTLGFESGLTRNIAFARSMKLPEKVNGFISSSIWFCILAGIMISILLFSISGVIATHIYHEQTLTNTLRILAPAIPFLILMRILVSVFLGFEDVSAKVLFQDIIRSGLFLLILAIVFVLNLSFNSVYYAYLSAAIIPCLILIPYSYKRLNVHRIQITGLRLNSTAKELIYFSIPLLGVAMLQNIIAWADTLMLGYFRTPGEVGLYNVSIPFSHLVSFPLIAIVLIYRPVMSRMYGRKQIAEMKRTFSILTKWLCYVSLPFTLLIFIYAEEVISFLFGAEYVSAADALRILSLGLFLSNLMGPNGAALVAIGKSSFLMWVVFGAVFMNIGLNVALIPPFGIEGAAIASVTAIVFMNTVRCWKMYSITGAQPLSMNLVKPAIVSAALVFLIQFAIGDNLPVNLGMLVLFLVIYYVVFTVSILLTRSLDREDIIMLSSLKKKVVVYALTIRSSIQRKL